MALDILGTISPGWALKRDLARIEREELRAYGEMLQKGYDAGGHGRMNQAWNAFNESAELTDRADRDTIRARARDMERNSDIFNSVVSPFVRNVIGRGVTPQARTEDKELNKQLEALWEEWTRARNCDVTETQSLNQMLRMLVRRKKVDGGMLLLKCYVPGGVLPFRLQAVEVDELAQMQIIPRAKGNKVVGGVEYNAWNRAVGYWIAQYDLDGMILPEARYYPAKNVIFLFSKIRPSQVREISDSKHILGRVRDANEFMTAVSLKQRIAACLAVFIKRLNPMKNGQPIMGRPGTPEADPQRPSYAGKQITPGIINELGINEEIQVVDPGSSGTDAGGFLKTLLRIIGAGLGLSYESTSRDMSQTNYSSARQGIIEDELTYQEEAELLAETMREIYETFVISAVLAGAVNIPRFWEDKRNYLRHKWVEAPKPWIDPLKEAKATQIALQTGQKTFKQISAEGGRDWQGQIDDMAEVAEYAASKNITIGGACVAGTGKQDDPKNV